LSLFYSDDITALKKITPSRKYLADDIYAKMVRDAVIVCVDIILVRRSANKKECLLIKRSSEPVKGHWWMPGGRMLKGETFFDGAVRKARLETGIEAVKPVQVLGVWNTFFPTSHWDTPISKGTQTVNAVVLVEILEDNAVVNLDDTSETYRWIGLDPDAAAEAGYDQYILEPLRRLKSWDPNYDS